MDRPSRPYNLVLHDGTIRNVEACMKRPHVDEFFVQLTGGDVVPVSEVEPLDFDENVELTQIYDESLIQWGILTQTPVRVVRIEFFSPNLDRFVVSTGVRGKEITIESNELDLLFVTERENATRHVSPREHAKERAFWETLQLHDDYVAFLDGEKPSFAAGIETRLPYFIFAVREKLGFDMSLSNPSHLFHSAVPPTSLSTTTTEPTTHRNTTLASIANKSFEESDFDDVEDREQKRRRHEAIVVRDDEDDEGTRIHTVRLGVSGTCARLGTQVRNFVDTLHTNGDDDEIEEDEWTSDYEEEPAREPERYISRDVAMENVVRLVDRFLFWCIVTKEGGDHSPPIKERARISRKAMHDHFFNNYLPRVFGGKKYRKFTQREESLIMDTLDAQLLTHCEDNKVYYKDGRSGGGGYYYIRARFGMIPRNRVPIQI